MDLDARYLRTAAFVGVQRGLHGTTAFDCAASLTSIAANSGTPTGSHDDITCLPYESETNVPLCGKTRATEDDTTDALKGLPREAKDASTESEAGLLRGKDTGATNGTVEWAQSGSGSMPPKRLTSVGRKGSRKGSFSRSAAPVKTTGQEASASETEGSPWTQRRSPGSDGSKQGSIPRSLSKKSGINAPEAAQQQDPSFASMRVKSFESAKSASVKVSFDHVESAETDPELTRRRSPKMDPSVRLSSTKRGQVGSSAVSDTDSDSLGASSRFDSIKPEVLEIRKREWTLDKAKTEAKLQKGGFSSTPVIAQLPGPPANASEESLGGRSSRSSRINVNAAGALPSIKEGVILPTTPKTTTHGLTAASRRMSDNKLVKTGLEISSLRASVVKSNKSSLNSCTSSNNGSDEKIHLAGLAKASHRDSDVKLHKQSTIKSISSALSFNISEADPYHQRLAQIYDRVGALDPINREIVDAATSISLGLAPTRTIRKNNVSLRKATHLQSRASIASNASSHVGPSRLNSLSRAMSMASAADFTDESFDVLQQVLVGAAANAGNYVLIDAQDIFKRLLVARSNCALFYINPKVTKWIDDKNCDFSVDLLVGGPPLPQKEGFRKLLVCIELAIESKSVPTPLKPLSNELDLPDNFFPPQPPLERDPFDYLDLALWYHDKGELKLSAFYLKREVEQEFANPIALYLLALVRRHGLGVRENKKQAFLDLLSVCEQVLIAIPSLYEMDREKLQFRSIPVGTGVGVPVMLGQALSSQQSMGLLLPKLPLSRESSIKSCMNQPAMMKRVSAVSLVRGEIGVEEAMWILSLPLFEIAVCFHQGWGIPKSIPAAIHFYKTAAGLGDPDAMYELGFLLLRGYHAKSWYERHHPEGIKEKMEAASWLRSAHGKGHTVVGESWIFQAKWGGTG